jgi:two-component system, chemotaxis family, sensor kinase CheA
VSPSSDERMAELRELFFESAEELLQALNDQGLKLEKSPADAEIVRTIRRVVHTLKGDAAACGYRELSELAHELEDALAVESAGAHAQMPQVAFTAADIFGAMLAAYRKGAEPPSGQSLQAMIRKLQAASVAKKGGRRKTIKVDSKTPSAAIQPAPRKKPWSEYDQLAAQNAVSQGKQLYDVTAEIDPHCGMPIAGRQLVHGALAGLGEIIAVRPEAGTPESGKFVRFLIATDKSADDLAAKSRVPTVVAKVRVHLVHGPAAPTRKRSKSELAQPSASTGDSAPAAYCDAEEPASHQELQSLAPTATGGENVLRVGAERIDNVLNLVGELIIGKSMFQQALNEFGRQFPKDPLRGKFADAVAFQARVLNDLQRSVMKIRMVPVEQLFRRFPRIVRDVAMQCGKQVELVVSGEDTDLDKSILDALAEPLTHLVRNAVGHAIESSEERDRLGKSPVGTIRLGAYHQGNQVIVEVSDDGCGIDAGKIKSKAVEYGFIDRDEAARLSEGETLEIIFRPGFSTAAEVTEVSGRGVGMDVVQSVLQRLKGSVAVETKIGEGTTFRLKLPLTLAIIKALLFRVEQRLYAIPLNSVTEIARTMESEVHQVDNYEALQLRNEVLPLIRLGRAPVRDERPHKLFILVITSGDKKFGLIVDGLEGEEELVIKALDDQTIATDLLSGASILGDGRVVLILNLAAVLEHFARLCSTAVGTFGSGLLLSQADRLRLAQNSVVQA